mmetsp:Transcript_60728/g.198845  ORF Transcript_60728/g.198845 Transcript_60728/m.198845 type:complete len:229 (-) Transcript_60728:166-852(-)
MTGSAEGRPSSGPIFRRGPRLPAPHVRRPARPARPGAEGAAPEGDRSGGRGGGPGGRREVATKGRPEPKLVICAVSLRGPNSAAEVGHIRGRTPIQLVGQSLRQLRRRRLHRVREAAPGAIPRGVASREPWRRRRRWRRWAASPRPATSFVVGALLLRVRFPRRVGPATACATEHSPATTAATAHAAALPISRGGRRETPEGRVLADGRELLRLQEDRRIDEPQVRLR